MIRSAASLIIAAPIPTELLRTNQGSNYRILMLKRNTKGSFVNAHVFPGGVVDPSDTVWPQKEPYTTEKICAIRETFEETGLLISKPSVTVADNDMWRERIHKDGSQFEAFCNQQKLKPATQRLSPFSHWTTPSRENKRYNTIFFMTVLEQHATLKEQERQLGHVMADGTENVLFNWLKPEEALEKCSQRQVVLIPPQWYSLHLMSKVPDYRHLSQVGQGVFRNMQGNLIPFHPKVISSDLDHFKGYVSYPGDENYDGKKGMKHRLYFNGSPMRDFELVTNISKL